MSSSAHFVDLAIFVTFLIVTLLAGFVYRRPMRTIKDFALGGKDFSTFVLTATIVATWFGGGTIAYWPERYYRDGLYFMLSSLGGPLCLLITGQVLAVRMKHFLHYLSPAEAMGEMYGETVRAISAISGMVIQISLMAAQFQVIAQVLALILGAQDSSFTILAAAIVMLYSAWGGIRAVTFTDVVQFFTFGTLIPILAVTIWNNLQNPQQITVALAQHPQFHLSEVVGWNARFINAISVLFFFATNGTNPIIFQRIVMARNRYQARRAFTAAAFIALLIFLSTFWVAILLRADNVQIERGKMLNYLVDQYTYIGFKGLLATGIVALAMSSADSCMNSCVVLVVNDIALPRGLSKRHVIATARFSTVIIGLLGLLLVLHESDHLSLLFLTASLYLPIVGVPLWLAIFGFRSSRRVVLMSMASGFATVLLWRIFLAHTGIDSVMPATLTSLVVMLSSHYFLGEPGGWQKKVAPITYRKT